MFEILSTSIGLRQSIKYFVYILACALLFILITQAFNGQIFELNTTGSVSAFEWEKQVNIYLPNAKMNTDDDCSLVLAVNRIVPNAETLGPGALEKLLLGPTEAEKEAGYFTNLNKGILLQKFEINNGVALIDFNSKFDEGVAGSCQVEATRSQIEKTLISLPDINEIIISINGQVREIPKP